MIRYIMADTIEIFGRAGCKGSELARLVYGSRARYHDVEADAQQYENMLRHSGGRTILPVIVFPEGRTVVGFLNGT